MGAERASIGIVADHVELKRWYERLGFVETETKAFDHLRFQVTFMVYDLSTEAANKQDAGDPDVHRDAGSATLGI